MNKKPITETFKNLFLLNKKSKTLFSIMVLKKFLKTQKNEDKIDLCTLAYKYELDCLDNLIQGTEFFTLNKLINNG